MKKIIPVLLIINTFLFIISLAFSFVILFRPVYYWQIKPLKIEENYGLKYDEIKEAYDGILDYSLLNKEFSIGKLTCSKDCKDHFKDCKLLFIINFVIFIITSLIKILEKNYCWDYKIRKHSINFWSSCGILSLFIIMTIITLIIGFNRIFTIFHNIFFLGKDNWLLDPELDTIINIFPKQFFINCGVLILVIVSIITITLIIKDIKKVKN